MAGKSQAQQQVDELNKVVFQLVAKVDHLDNDVQEGKVGLAELRRDTAEMRTNFAILARDLDEVRRSVEELKQQRKEAGHQWWMLIPPLGGALASVLLSALVAYLINRK